MQKDAWKVAIGIVVFLGFFTFPIWYNLAVADPLESDLPVRPDTQNCILTQSEKLIHMQILDQWRDEVVRDGQRFRPDVHGALENRSFTKTCLSSGCHQHYEDVPRPDGSTVPACWRCHRYAGVEGGTYNAQTNQVEGELFREVYCWDCHVNPPADAPNSNAEARRNDTQPSLGAGRNDR